MAGAQAHLCNLFIVRSRTCMRSRNNETPVFLQYSSPELVKCADVAVCCITYGRTQLVAKLSLQSAINNSLQIQSSTSDDPSIKLYVVQYASSINACDTSCKLNPDYLYFYYTLTVKLLLFKWNHLTQKAQHVSDSLLEGYVSISLSTL